MRIRAKALRRKRQLHAKEKQGPKKKERAGNKSLFQEVRRDNEQVSTQNVSPKRLGKPLFGLYLVSSKIGKQDSRLMALW